MEALFLKILNMSITATYVFIAVLILRLLLRRVPKWISYSLWSLMLFRLVCPISFSSTFSFFGKIGKTLTVNNSIEHFPADIGMMATPQVNIGPPSADSVNNSILPAATPIASVNPMQIFIFIGTCIWLTGIVLMLIYNTATYLRLKYRMREATLLSDNVFETDKIASPFVCGLIKPQIYLPVGLQKYELKYVLCHEQTHIKRKDHLIKFLAFLTLSLHWFNPFVWLAFILMSRDLEMSCDERVICRLDSEGKAEYSTALIHLAMKCSPLAGSPLAFGECGIKGRVKNVLNYRKPAVWLVIASIIIVIAIGISCLANPADDKEPDLSLLNYKNLSTLAYQMDELLVSQAPGLSESFNISARAVAEYLDSTDWIIKDVELPPESVSDIKIEWNESQDLQFYNSEPFLAMTRINAQRRYYAISRGDYEKMLSLINQAAGPQNETMQEGGQDGKLEPASPNISLGQEIGVDMAGLDYASDDIVIFHDYFGLFVYDLNFKQIVRSLDLKPIGCNVTQGDNYCEVTVSTNGNTVQLHPISSKNMYVYNVSNNTLQEMAYERMENRFADFVDIVDVIDYQKAGSYSHTAVKFDNGEYGYLHTSDWTVGTLSYIRGDMVYRLFDLFENTKLYDEPVSGKVNILVSPTSLDPRSKYWYVPDDQQKLSDMMDDIQWTQISKFPQNTYRLNIEIRKDDFVCEMLSNGAFYYWDISGTENSFLGENKNLNNEILWILREKLSFEPLDQLQITDLIAVEVVYTQQNTERTFTQRITDNNSLRLIENQFQSAKPQNGLTACPFYEAIMTLEKKDGATIQLRLATDSCPMYLANGVCFEVKSSILRLFNEIPWRSRP